jgi:hypothetical protein
VFSGRRIVTAEGCGFDGFSGAQNRVTKGDGLGGADETHFAIVNVWKLNRHFGWS